MDVSLPTPPANLVELLDASARARPDDVALLVPQRDGSARQVTRGQLHADVSRLAAALAARGVGSGDRVLVMLPLSLELYIALIAVLRLASTAVFVEPALGLRDIARCCDASEPKAFVGTAKAHILRSVSRGVRSAPVRLSVGARVPGAERFEDLLAPAADSVTLAADGVTPAVISYTSGTTGAPKEIHRTHQLLWAQHRAIAEGFPHDGHDVGLSALPMFVLHDLASGTPAVLPRRAGRSASEVDVPAAVRQIQEHGVTILRGAPRFYARIADHCEARGTTLPSVRALFIGGAPVASGLLVRLRRLLPNGSAYVVYGSTEAEPIAAVDAAEALVIDAPAGGTCVGRAVGATKIRVAADGSASAADAAPLVVGEVVVAGPHVRAAHDGWHRTGDAGYRDEHGRLWLVGRVSDRVLRAGVAMYPLQLEPILDELPFVGRSALIGLPDPQLGQRAVVVVATRGGPLRRAFRSRAWRREIVARCAALGSAIDEVRFTGAIPLDRRHRSKVLHDVLRERHGHRG